jgi:hypothetical protein
MGGTTVPASLLERLRAFAERTHRSMSSVVEEALTRFLTEEEPKKPVKLPPPPAPSMFGLLKGRK